MLVAVALTLMTPTSVVECDVLRTAISPQASLDETIISIVDEGGQRAGELAFTLARQPYGFSPFHPEGAVDADTGEALIEITSRINQLRRSSPSLARGLARGGINRDRALLEVALGPIPEGLVENFVERNGVGTDWDCTMSESVRWAARAPDRSRGVASTHLSLSRPGISSDDRYALIYLVSETQVVLEAGAGRFDFYEGWRYLDRDEVGRWRIIESVGISSALGP